ncbi:MAG: phosphoribosylglycinamide synthetase C domain-containing protein [Armatimonas sp.]
MAGVYSRLRLAGETLTEAKERAYAAVDKIHFDGAYVRRDIGWRAL